MENIYHIIIKILQYFMSFKIQNFIMHLANGIIFTMNMDLKFMILLQLF